jgi:hypothetical protein
MKFEIDKKYIFRVNRFKKINKLVFYGKSSFNVGAYSSWSTYLSGTYSGWKKGK